MIQDEELTFHFKALSASLWSSKPSSHSSVLRCVTVRPSSFNKRKYSYIYLCQLKKQLLITENTVMMITLVWRSSLSVDVTSSEFCGRCLRRESLLTYSSFLAHISFPKWKVSSDSAGFSPSCRSRSSARWGGNPSEGLNKQCVNKVTTSQLYLDTSTDVVDNVSKKNKNSTNCKHISRACKCGQNAELI